MKVLNVEILLDPITGGGTAERTFQMSRSLARAGAQCTVLTVDLGLTPEHINAMEGVRVIATPCLIERFKIPRFSYWQLKNTVRDADIVHLMGHWSFLNVLLYFLTRKLNKPYVICPAGTLLIYGRSKLLKGFYNKMIGERILRHADGAIAITAHEIEQFQAYGVETAKITVIANGINAQDFQAADDAAFRDKHKLDDHPFILFMGRLNYFKGPDLLLQAFCNLKDELANHHLVFAGPDEGMLAELKEYATAQGVGSRVHFVGYLGGIEKSQAYHAADLLVIPSRHEAMSIVALEAGITGTPVLLTDQCGFDEVAEIGGGQVVPASVEGLQAGLGNLLNNATRLKVKGERLKRYVHEYYSWDAIIQKYLKLYRHILAFKN